MDPAAGSSYSSCSAVGSGNSGELMQGSRWEVWVSGCSHNSRMTEYLQEQTQSIPWRSDGEYNFLASWRTGNCWVFSLSPFPCKVDATLSPGWAVLAGAVLCTIRLKQNSYELFDGSLSPPKSVTGGDETHPSCLHFCPCSWVSLASG